MKKLFKILRFIADLKQNVIRLIEVPNYFNSDEWEVKKLPYRYLFSAQFKGIVVLLILSWLTCHYAGLEELEYTHVFAGAAIMRLLTLDRFY